jgi:hypothetical protein
MLEPGGPLPVQPPPGWPRWAVALLNHCLVIVVATILAVAAVVASIYVVISISSFFHAPG